MADYFEDIQSALEDIRENGTFCNWFRPHADPAVGDHPWDDDVSIAPEEFPNIPILFFPINRVDFESLRDIKGTDIPQRREQGLLPGAVPFIPALKDYLEVNGVRYSVFNYDRIAPNDIAILYILHLQEE